MSISFFQLSNRSPANGRASLWIKIVPDDSDDSDDSIDRVPVQCQLCPTNTCHMSKLVRIYVSPCVRGFWTK